MKTTNRMLRVLIVDDHTMIAEGLGMILDASPDVEVVGMAETGPSAVEKAAETQPDVMLVDLRLPVFDGIEVIRKVKAQSPDISFIVVSSSDQDEDVFEALQAGATGYLPKNSSREELRDAILTVHKGQSYLNPAITSRLVNRFARARGEPERPYGLTIREAEVLQLMVDGRANAEIGRALVLSESTIKGHVTRILDKLGVRDRTQAVAFALKHRLVKDRIGGSGGDPYV